MGELKLGAVAQAVSNQLDGQGDHGAGVCDYGDGDGSERREREWEREWRGVAGVVVVERQQRGSGSLGHSTEMDVPSVT